MKDLLGTVRQRYGQWPGFFNLFTLTYRSRTFLSREMTHRIEQWQSQSAYAEKSRQEAAKRLQRRTEQYFEDTGGQLRYLHRQTKQLLRREEERQREKERKPKMELPLTYRAAERLMEERVIRIETALREELHIREKRNEREILRRIREEEYYEKRRRGW